MTFIARSTVWGIAGARHLAAVRGRPVGARVPSVYRSVRGPRWQGTSAVPPTSVTSSPSSSPSPPPPFQAQSSETNTTSNTTSPPPPQQPKSKPILRALLFLLATTACFTAGFTMASAPVLASVIETATQSLQPPSDAETLTLFTPPTADLAEIERQIFSHPLTQSLLSDPKYIASRPHLRIPETLRAQNLTAGTLLGANKIAVPPLQFHTADGSEFASLQYLGPALCGHPGVVHGGLLATLLDEGLARCCFPALPNKIAVTASLKVDYKRPTMAGQIVVLRAETTKVEGRKAWVKGRLETLADPERGVESVVLAEAEALFIEPRGAENMKKVIPT
ncbi:Thioesterase/thiol ester dehydrase-isomerase [Westerdykella ornata]|uniref:Thioesterase/thiol ester dehydrase-isomerase n=1 Tax=Westerdykella ornata TaxID=318751 RepID=A0A6A6JIF8_WESOR|nr:Thioesterase/thiol ester dehydrase-isomerase [Westerdykella ornata]KAF2276025.1 Thioesterase/thiol ester dehydrase-isomerase [Westerdykella ornata]